MAEPITWQALEHVRDMLLQVTRANGYHTDIGLHPVVLSGDQLPETTTLTTFVGLVTNTFDDTRSGRHHRVSECEFVVEVAVPLGDGTEAAELLAHRARADVIRVLDTGLRDAPAGFNSLVATSAEIGTPEGGSSTVIAQVTARAGLTERYLPA